MHALAIAQAAKVDRKLYIGNLPTGITPSTVNLIYLKFFFRIFFV